MRKPDKVIGVNYLSRWHIIPRNPILNIYLHKFTGSDDDRAHHDHPFSSVSFLIKGKMVEHYKGRHNGNIFTCLVRDIDHHWPVFRSAKHSHRLELKSLSAWTLFITGPRVRDWGFLCRKGWVSYKEFTDSSGNQIGAGCGEE